MAPDYRRLRDLGRQDGDARWAAPPPPPPGRMPTPDRTPPDGWPVPGVAAPPAAQPAARQATPPATRGRGPLAVLAGDVAAAGTALKAAIVLCALAVVGLIVALIVVPAPSRTGGATTASGGPAHGATSPSAATAPAAGAPTSAAPTTAAPTTAAPTTTAAPAPSGPGPVISALSPDTGHPGQRVSISGANLASANGKITVMFGSVQAGVSCSSQTTCVATVPPQPGGVPPGGRVPVTLGTTGGTSKAVPFTYR